MAVAVTIRSIDYTAKKRVVADLVFSGTYTTGGEAPTNGFLRNLGLSSIEVAHIEGGAPVAQAALGHVAKYEYSTDKVTLWEGAAGADAPMEEVTSGQSIANLTLRGSFLGNTR